MKWFGGFTVWLMGIVFAAGVFAQSGVDYFPMSVGNYWEYTLSQKSDSLLAGPTRREVAGFQADGERKVFSVTNEAAGQSKAYAWFRVQPDGEVAMFSLSIGPDLGSSLMDFDPPVIILPGKPAVGHTWEITLPNSKNENYTAGTFRIESDREPVTVPAGTFRNCLKIKQILFDESGQETGVMYHYYARSVGNVLTEQTSPENKRYRSELNKYTVK